MKNDRQRTILIAEDNNDSREMLREFLEHYGFHVVEAANGKKAIEVARLVLPDLILMDLHMPELDGVSAAQYIRRQSELSKVPIIANSANGNLAIELFSNLKELGSGFLEYIPKPLNFDALIELIEKAFSTTDEAA